MRLGIGFIVGALSLSACGGAEHGTVRRSDTDVARNVGAAPIVASAPALAEAVADSIGNVGVPPAVADVGTHGEDVFDQAKEGNWPKASAIMDSLDRSVQAPRASERAQIAPVLDSLHRAVAAHQAAIATEAANRVTWFGAKFTEAYHPKMPADIVRLDYYGRELEIWAARKDTARLSSTARLTLRGVMLCSVL